MAEKRNSSVKEDSKGEVVISRIFNAPRRLVFKAWTDPNHLIRWWAPKDFTTPFCNVDLRIGGMFRYCMRTPDGKDIWGRGVYREIIEPERIVYTDCFTDEQGHPVPPTHYGLSSDSLSEGLVTVILAEYEGKTKLTLRYSEMIEIGAEREMAQQGWNEMFDRLDEFIAGNRKGE
jgi:uncharacterized protein YndB with AHSA1/START domain